MASVASSLAYHESPVTVRAGAVSVRERIARFETDRRSEEDEVGVGSARQLWPSTLEEREELQKRRSRILQTFGTYRFTQPREESAATLRQTLKTDVSHLSEQDFKLYRWPAMSVILNDTSNAFCKRWVLSGQSGCVSLASSLTTCWVLGAGQTIWCSQADAVSASRSDSSTSPCSIVVRFEGNGWVTLKVPQELLADEIVQAINSRAAKRAQLRRT